MFASFLCNNGSVTTVVVKKCPHSELLERGHLYSQRDTKEGIDFLIQPNKPESESYGNNQN